MTKKSQVVVGYYFSPDEILEAAAHARDRKFKNFDTFTPFAVHGMEEAMGIKRSLLPFLSFGAGLVGFIAGTFLTVWTHMFSWPMNIAGKPILAIPAYIPIMFELTVLICGVSTAVAMFILFLRLPNFKKKPFHPDITNDRFALAIEVDNEDEVAPVKRFLSEIKAQEVHAVEGGL